MASVKGLFYFISLFFWIRLKVVNKLEFQWERKKAFSSFISWVVTWSELQICFLVNSQMAEYKVPIWYLLWPFKFVWWDGKQSELHTYLMVNSLMQPSRINIFGSTICNSFVIALSNLLSIASIAFFPLLILVSIFSSPECYGGLNSFFIFQVKYQLSQDKVLKKFIQMWCN